MLSSIQPSTSPAIVALLCLAALAPAGCGPGGGAAVEGRVVYTGDPPAAATLDMGSAPVCAELHDGPVPSRDLLLGPSGGLDGALVVLRGEGLAGQAPPPPEEPVVLEQRGCLFHPPMVAVRAGQPLVVRNLDPTYHHLVGEPADNPGFDLAQPFEGMETRLVFESPEPMIPVRSEVHPWMRAWISVLPHPWFAVTGEDGAFRIEGVPPGEYTLEVHHGEIDAGRRPLSVPEGEGVVSGVEVMVR